MVAKENDDVGNLLLFVRVVLNDEDEKNTFLEEEEEEEKVLALLFIVVVVAIRPRSACLIINKSLKNKMCSDIMERRAIFARNACLRAHKNGRFSLPLKKKKKSHSVFLKRSD